MHFLSEGLCHTPLPGTKTWGLLFSSLAFCVTFLVANSVAWAFVEQIFVFLSALSHVTELDPFPLGAAAFARNDFISSICITIDDISSYVASSNHNYVWYLSVDLPLLVSVTSEYLNFLTFQKMWYFLASHQETHLAMSGKKFTISSSILFVHCVVLQLQLYTSCCKHFLNLSLKLTLLWARPYLCHFGNAFGE